MSDSFERSVRFTRRTATVTMSAPLASWQRFISGKLRYFPVPTIRRDANSRPAITSLFIFFIVTFSVATAGSPRLLFVHILEVRVAVQSLFVEAQQRPALFVRQPPLAQCRFHISPEHRHQR